MEFVALWNEARAQARGRAQRENAPMKIWKVERAALGGKQGIAVLPSGESPPQERGACHLLEESLPRCPHEGCHVPATRGGSCGNHEGDKPGRVRRGKA